MSKAIKKRSIRKNDIVLFILLIAIGAVMSVISVSSTVSGDKAVVTVDGKLYGTYDLSRDHNVVIRRDGYINEFIIKDGQVQMTKSDCKNQICVHQGRISRAGQTIACLPNRVLIRIEQNRGSHDAISR